jgi:hypothetical protein
MRRSEGLGIVGVLAIALLIGVGCSGAGSSNGSKGTAGSPSGASGAGDSGGASDGGAGTTGAAGVAMGGSSGEGGTADGGPEGSDAASDAPLSFCPASEPQFGTTCTGKLSCQYGHSSCCGYPSSEMTCVCSFGYFDCSQTVECNVICPDAGGN